MACIFKADFVEDFLFLFFSKFNVLFCLFVYIKSTYTHAHMHTIAQPILYSSKRTNTKFKRIKNQSKKWSILQKKKNYLIAASPNNYYIENWVFFKNILEKIKTKKTKKMLIDVEISQINFSSTVTLPRCFIIKYIRH